MAKEIADEKGKGEELLTLPSVAVELGISRSSVFSLARRGVLRSARAGRVFVVRREDLERFRVEHPPRLVIRKYA